MRVDFPGGNALVVNLHSSFCENHAVETAGDDHVIAFDLSLDACFLAKDEVVGRNQQAPHFAFDAEGSRTFKGSFETDRFIEKAGPFGNGF